MSFWDRKVHDWQFGQLFGMVSEMRIMTSLTSADAYHKLIRQKYYDLRGVSILEFLADHRINNCVSSLEMCHILSLSRELGSFTDF